MNFLTVLPVGPSSRPGGAMLYWFPAAGLLLGLALAVFDTIAGAFFQPPLRGILDVLFLAAVTGGLHLDGLADTADGLFSHRDPQRKLAIMKDSRTGAFGVLALIFVLSIKAAAVNQSVFTFQFPLPLLAVPLFGRTAMLAGMAFLPYGRGEEGIGADLFGPQATTAFFISLALLLILTVFMGPRRLLILTVLFAVVVAGMLFWYRRSVGCVTGDMLGALGEASEAAVLLGLAL
jgi:adenosylcobinamide-GDP ribazoletransferase